MKMIVDTDTLYIIDPRDPDNILRRLLKGQLFVTGKECYRYNKKITYLGPGWALVDWYTGEVLWESEEITPVIF